LYFNALQHGLNNLPEADPATRAAIDARAEREGWPALHAELAKVDPVTAARLMPNDAQRIERALEIWQLTGKPMSQLLAEDERASLPYRLLKIALLPSDRAVLHQRIAERFDTMLQAGLLDELTHLRQTYPDLNLNFPAMRCVGYRQAWQYQEGEFDLATLREKGIAATRQLAKRQMTWLRGMGDVHVLDCLEMGLPQMLEHQLRALISR